MRSISSDPYSRLNINRVLTVFSKPELISRMWLAYGEWLGEEVAILAVSSSDGERSWPVAILMNEKLMADLSPKILGGLANKQPLGPDGLSEILRSIEKIEKNCDVDWAKASLSETEG